MVDLNWADLDATNHDEPDHGEPGVHARPDHSGQRRLTASEERTDLVEMQLLDGRQTLVRGRGRRMRIRILMRGCHDCHDRLGKLVCTLALLSTRTTVRNLFHHRALPRRSRRRENYCYARIAKEYLQMRQRSKEWKREKSRLDLNVSRRGKR